MFNIGTTTVTCVATDAKSITNSCTFTVTLNAPPKIALERFLAFGDSMTWGENGLNTASTVFDAGERLRPAVQLPFADTYPGALQNALRDRYTVQTFPRFVGFTSSGQYSAVLLMEGANDLADRDSRIFPTVISGLRRMISDAKSRGMRVFLATIPPENPAGFRALAWSLVPGFNDQIRLLASSEGVTLVDIHQAFNNDLSLIGADGLHPNANGYHKIADTFFASLRQQLEVSPGPTPTALPNILPTRR